MGYKAKTTISKLGVFDVSLEKGYLPGFGNKLISNDFMNIGFVRYFN